MDQIVVGGSTAVYLQSRQVDAGIGFHGGKYIVGLVGNGIQSCPDDVVLVDTPGQSHDTATGIGIPLRCAQTGKSRHHIATIGIGNFLGHILGIGSRFNKPQLIPEPLNGSAGHENGTFQGISHFSVQSPADGGDQAVFGENRLVSGIHQQKGTGTVSAFGIAGIKTGLTEESCLLVTGSTGDGNGFAKELSICLSVHTTGWFYFRQHGNRNFQLIQNFLIPLQGVDIKKHGTGGIGIVGHMDSAAGEFPNQPGFHGAEQQLAFFCLFSGTGDIFQKPANLGAGEIGIDDQTGFAADGIHQSFSLQCIAIRSSPAALPYDGVVNRSAGIFIPDDGGFPLVGDANSRNVGSFHTGVAHCLLGNFQLGGKNLVRIVLHPTGLGENLGKFLLGNAADVTCFVKENAAVGGGTGVQCHNIFRHRKCSLPVDNHTISWVFRIGKGLLDF